MKEILICFVFLLIIMFLIDFLILKKFHINELEYMKARFKLKKSLKETKKIKIITSLINSFILSLVIVFAIYCKWNLFIILIISFLLLTLLIYIIYGIYGKFLMRKQDEKKVKKINVILFFY